MLSLPLMCHCGFCDILYRRDAKVVKFCHIRESPSCENGRVVPNGLNLSKDQPFSYY
jgi:hypothetical protein